MLTKVIMPAGGQTTDESVLVKWHKRTGDIVRKGDVLFEIETDKANMEIESYADGMLLSTFFAEGDAVRSGMTVAYIGDESDIIPDSEQKKTEKKEEVTSGRSDFSYKKSDTGLISASPAARHLAGLSGIPIGDVAASVSSMPVKKADVERYISEAADASDTGSYHTETSNMRRTIAERMTLSVLSAPQYSLAVDIDMTNAGGLREKLNMQLAGKGIKIAFNDILMKCVSKVIAKYPYINAEYGKDRIRVYKKVNFGIAVSIDEGLIVPVIKDTDSKTLADIAVESAKKISLARSGKLEHAETEGGTITLSNLGMFGIKAFTAIIRPPESCIIAAGEISMRPEVYEGQLTQRLMMTLTASFDHRLIDGAYAAAFMADVREAVAYPLLNVI